MIRVSSAATSGPVEITVIKSMAFGIIVLGGLVLSIFLSFDLIPSDVDKKTIYTILSKPVWRWQYVLGKYLGTCMALAVNIGQVHLHGREKVRLDLDRLERNCARMRGRARAWRSP